MYSHSFIEIISYYRKPNQFLKYSLIDFVIARKKLLFEEILREKYKILISL